MVNAMRYRSSTDVLLAAPVSPSVFGWLPVDVVARAPMPKEFLDLASNSSEPLSQTLPQPFVGQVSQTADLICLNTQ